jgi:hypothetical protein
MKIAFLAVSLAGLLLIVGDVHAQVYDIYYYWDGTQYQQFLPEQADASYYADATQYPYPQYYDPYYQLHVLHYQLYLPQNQFYQVYPPCCFVGGAIIPGRPRPIRPRRPVIINPFPRSVRRR